MCLPDPVSSSLVQSVMSMASSHSQHSHISTDTMSSMSGSYLAGGEGETGADDRGDVDAEEESQDAYMESRGPSQQDGVGSPGVEGGGCHVSEPFVQLPVSLFPSGVFPGATGKQLFPGCGGAGFRGEQHTFVNAAVSCSLTATFCVFFRETTSLKTTAPPRLTGKVNTVTTFLLSSRLPIKCKNTSI